MDCLLAGDSIAHTLARALPECIEQASGGISSYGYVAHFTQHLHTDTAVISLGFNDVATVRTADALREARMKLTARLVVWLLPAAMRCACRATIRQIAGEFGDAVVDMRQYDAAHLHPGDDGAARFATALREGRL
jgi:hypothetical protein